MTNQKNYYRVYKVYASSGMRVLMFDEYDTYEEVMDKMYRFAHKSPIDSLTTWSIERYEKVEVLNPEFLLRYGVYVDGKLEGEFNTLETALHQLNNLAPNITNASSFAVKKIVVGDESEKQS